MALTDCVPMPFPTRDEYEAEIFSDIYSRIPNNLAARLAAMEAASGNWAVGVQGPAGTGQDYVEVMSELTVVNPDVWEEVDLAAFGVGADEVCEILFTYVAGVAAFLSVGARAVGSGLDRTTEIRHFRGDVFTLHVKSADVSATVELFLENTVAWYKVYLLGFWTGTGEITSGADPGHSVDISDDTNLAAGAGITLANDTLLTNDAEIDHDALLNFVADEHIDWKNTTEDLLTTGDIDGVNVTSGADPGHTHTGASLSDIDISADTNLSAGTGITITDDTLSTNDGEIIHGDLSGFVLDEHIDHTAVSVIAGTGLAGGGTLAADRTLALSHLGIQDLVDPDADKILFWDDGAGKAEWLVPSTGLQIVGTNILTKDSEIIHDDLSGFVANEHIDWTAAAVALYTSSTGRFGGELLVEDKIKFTQTDGNEYIDSANSDYMDYGATLSHRFHTGGTHKFTIDSIGNVQIVYRNSVLNFSSGWGKINTAGGTLYLNYDYPTNSVFVGRTGSTLDFRVYGTSKHYNKATFYDEIDIDGALNHDGATAGFYGTTPIAQALLATGAGATVDNVITALQNIGLVKQA